MSDPTPPTRVFKALYHFKGQNNDELWFNKGDIITITQSVEGGWWEGTLDGKTGWFPSNFVKEVKPDGRSGARSPTAMKPNELILNKRESIITYHDVVIRSLKDTERTFVNDLHLLLQTYLRPLQNENILSKIEYSHLVGNLEELASVHHILLSSLDECAKQPVLQQRIGGLFISMAPQLKGLYHSYCSNHPRAVYVLQRYREELNKFMENKGAPPPGIETLTTSLSKPFTRRDKYSSMLKELERHTDECHPDRGDTQRAISVYREIATSCADIRKQKEVEYEIMNSTIKGWEGEEISKIGEVLLLSHVRVHSENGEKKERLFLLFPGLLVMLSVSPRLSQYIYEGKMPVSGLTINPLEDSDNHSYAFEITGAMIDRRVVSCGSNTEKKLWVETLRYQSKLAPAQVSAKPQNITVPSVVNVPQAKTAQTAQVVQPLPQKPKVVARTEPPTPWSLSCLRPAPPLRPILVGKEEAARSPRSGRKLLGAGKRKPDDPKTLEEDALILKVIEAYCTSAKARHTVNSLDLTKIRLTPHEMRDAILESPQVLIVEEEKIIVEENKGGQVVLEEKSLVDTVYSLKDQVKELKQEHQKLRKDLEDEKKARKRLENMLRKSLRSIVETNFEENTIAVQS